MKRNTDKSLIQRHTEKILNKKFNRLTPIEYIGIAKRYTGRTTMWKCKCDCGNEKIVSSHNLLNKGNQSCGCLKTEKGKNSKNWKGYEEISGHFWAHLKDGAKVRNLEFNITIEYIWDLFLKQNKKCKLTGLDLCFPIKLRKYDGTVSIDRIDSNLGYIEGNIQIIHKHVNKMKMDLDQEYFIQMCNLIAKTCPTDKNPEEIILV